MGRGDMRQREKEAVGGRETPKTPKVSARRSQLETRMDILRVMLDGAERPTEIMYKANISWVLLCDHLAALVEQGFVEEKKIGNRTQYSPTRKGIEMANAYLDLLRETFLEVPPIHQTAADWPDRDSLESAFGIDGKKGLIVARMINRERHKPNA